MIEKPEVLSRMTQGVQDRIEMIIHEGIAADKKCDYDKFFEICSGLRIYLSALIDAELITAEEKTEIDDYITDRICD